jgi:hypothetical protein
MIAVDDGLMSGHLDLADFFFLAAAIVAVVAGVGRLSRHPNAEPFVSAMVAFAVAAIAFGLLAL